MSRLRLAKIATPSSPPSTTAELFYSLTDSKLEAVDENGKIAVLGGFASSDFRLIRVFWITASGTQPPGVSGSNPYTYTPTAGAHALYVEAIGGGGGGAGVFSTTANAAVSGGGASGGYSASFLPSLAAGATYTVTIGAGGTAGAASGGVGGAGGTTSFGSNPVANGGNGSPAGPAAGTLPQGAAGGTAGAVGTGDLAAPGNAGNRGVVVSGTLAASGGGAPSVLGGGGIPQLWSIAQAVSGAGGAVVAGAGGNGAISLGTQGAPPGQSGAPGIVRIWEFA